MPDKTLYYNAEYGMLTDSSGVELKNPRYIPSIIFQAREIWRLNVRDGASAKDLSDAVLWSAAIDKDKTAMLINGALTADVSGHVTAITADGFSTTLPDAGVLWLINGAGQSESVAYSMYNVAGGVYTFFVDATLEYVYLNNDTCQVEKTAPMCRTLNSNIDSSRAASGILDILFDTNTCTFLGAVNGNTGKLPVFVEVAGYVSGGIPKYVFQFGAYALMRVDPNNGVPPGPVSLYYTKTEADSRFAKLVGDSDIEITDETKGIVFKVGSNKYRLNLVNDGGIITTQITAL